MQTTLIVDDDAAIGDLEQEGLERATPWSGLTPGPKRCFCCAISAPRSYCWT